MTTLCNFFRGLLVLLCGPVLVGLISMLALIMTVVFRVSAETVQVLPRRTMRLISRLGGVTVTISGIDGLDRSRPYIFAANHQSQFDIVVLQGYLGFDFRWLAKQELFNIPVFGQAMRRAGYVPVDRSHGRQALKSLDEAARRIAAGTSVIIFPEGTRSRDGNMLPFKPGAMVLAIKAGVPLVPVAITGTHAILPKGKLLSRPGRVTIRAGEPIDSSAYTLKQKHELAERLEGAVAALKEQQA